MASDAVVTSSSDPATSKDQLASNATQGHSKMTRRCYSMVELMDLATKPLSKQCPAPLNYENVSSNNPWLLKIVPGPHQDTAGGQNSSDRPTGTAEERARSLRMDIDLGMTFKPQRLSFTDGCRASNALSPQKGSKAMSMLSSTKEIVRDKDYETFGERSRDGPGNGLLRGGSREFVNTRMQSNNNPRYGNYNEDRDRYNNGGRGYGDRGSQSGGGFQRSYSREPHDDRGYDRGFVRNNNRDHDRGDDLRPQYHVGGGDLEQEEPEWMNDGPTSQNEYIELRGFDDDIADEDKDKKGPEKEEKMVNGFVVDKISGELRREIIKEPVKIELEKKPEKAKDQVDESKPASLEPPFTLPSMDELSLMDNLDKSLNLGNVSASGRSRFMDLFSSTTGPSGKSASDKMKPASESTPTATHAPPHLQSVVQEQKPTVVHQQFSQQEAGRNLLLMLQKNDAAANMVPGAANPPPLFKTLEDIESEQMQSANALPNTQQRPPFVLPRDSGMFSRPSSSGMDLFSGGAGSPQLRPSSPVQPVHPQSRFMPVMGDQPTPPLIQIPDDPNLHKLLNLPHQDLIRMRDMGHFDHHTLLTLIQMKQQKEALAHQLPSHFQIPISVPISSHGLGLPQRQPYNLSAAMMAQQLNLNHARMAGGHMPPQMRYAPVPNMMAVAQQEALMRQMSGAHSPSATLLAHEMAMLRMANPHYSNTLSMEDLTHLEASRAALASRQGTASPTAGRPSPSPLLPTAVLRKTVQRGDSMTNMLPSSLHQSASSPQLMDQYQNRHQAMQHHQQQQSRMLEEEQHHRNLLLAARHREEEQQRNLLMAQHQLQGQYQYPGQGFALSGHFPGQHNLPQPDF